MNEILEYLNEQEKVKGIKEVREACRKYLLKKTYAGCEKIKRKPIPRSWKVHAFANQNGICPRCRAFIDFKSCSGDHIVPLAKGGLHRRDNIQVLHPYCNSSKGANDMVRESKLQQLGKTRRALNENEI